MTASYSEAAGPAKVVLERRVRPGADAGFAQWARELVASAARTRALEGSTVLTTAGGESVILLRFATRDDLDRWRSASETAEILARGARHSSGADQLIRTGFETWFAIPGGTAVVPARWKMALVTWLALYPLVAAVVPLVPPSVPFAANVAITTALPLVLLTWVVMPWLTARLEPWLYRAAPP